MTIVFDVTHLAHINLFKNAIDILEEQGHKVVITALNRGKLSAILNAELPDKNTAIIGEYTNSTLGVIWNSNIKRTYELTSYLEKYNPDIFIGSESISVLLAAKLFEKPSLLFSDDPERPVATFLKLWLATKVYYPNLNFDFKWFKDKIEYYKALKQWAYLSPSQFEPNKEVLEKNNLRPKEYFFVRDVSTSSVNYKKQSADSLTGIADKLPNEFDYILSLEKKESRDLFPTFWKILQEPVEGIHSLMYYSKAIISTGDSMVREGAMMGVPSYYCGIRNMSANKVMEDKGMLFEVAPKELPLKLCSLLKKNSDLKSQSEFIKNLDKDWVDLTNYIVNKIEEYEE